MVASVSGYARFLGAGHGAVLVWGSLGLALVVVAGRWVGLGAQHRLLDRIGAVDFSFGDSWATTITGIGALLGTILGTAGILPDNATPLSGNAFTGLNLLFAMVAAFAPLVFSAFQARTASADGGAPSYQGFVGTFLLACLLTVWAAVGEIATIILLLREIQEGFLTGSMVWLFLAMLVVSIVAVLVYGWIRIQATVEFNRSSRDLAARTGAPLPRWNLL